MYTVEMNKIYVCGNSTAYGIELDKTANSIQELRAFYREMSKSHSLAWPEQIHVDGFTVENCSKPLYGLFHNCCTVLKKFRGNTHDIFLIDVSLVDHLPDPEDNYSPKANIFLNENIFLNKKLNQNIQDFFYSTLNQFINVFEILGIKYYFYYSFDPFFKFYDNDGILKNELLQNFYAKQLRESVLKNIFFNPEKYITHHLLFRESIFSLAHYDAITNYCHISGPDQHKKIGLAFSKALSQLLK